jgi:hypothetical protein
MNRDEYVDERTEFQLQDEGRAQLNALQVRAEIRQAGGPDIGIPGAQDAAFERAYNDLAAGKTTREQAVQQMANLMATEKPSRPYATYRDMYRAYFNFVWDTDYDEPAMLPPRH